MHRMVINLSAAARLPFIIFMNRRSRWRCQYALPWSLARLPFFATQITVTDYRHAPIDSVNSRR